MAGSSGGRHGRRILMALRLYSGLEKSIADGVWQPTGVPTIYRLVEALERQQAALKLFLLGRTAASDRQDRDVPMTGLRVVPRILAATGRVPGWLGAFRPYVSELRQAWEIWKVARRLRPDIVYVDRGSLWVAGLMARVTRRPVVYRVMGISEALTSTWNSRHPVHRVESWLLRAPFAAVICTLDGSGGEVWMPRLFRPGVPTHLLINGVDRGATGVPPLTLPSGKTRIGFVGRFEDIKGSREFLAAFLLARAQRPGRLHAVMIGSGPLLPAMQADLARAGAGEDITIIPSLPHREMGSAYAAFDIYVSLNRQGNLSNANIEAFTAGCCAIVPHGDAASGRDVALDGLFPPDSLLRIASPDDTAGLAQAILRLHDDPAERQDRSRRIAAIAEQAIPSWEVRIDQELRILDALARP